MSPGSGRVYDHFWWLFFRSIRLWRCWDLVPNDTPDSLRPKPVLPLCHPAEIAWNVLCTVARGEGTCRHAGTKNRNITKTDPPSVVSGGETRPASARTARPRPVLTSERRRWVSRRTESATKKIPPFRTKTIYADETRDFGALRNRTRRSWRFSRAEMCTPTRCRSATRLVPRESRRNGGGERRGKRRGKSPPHRLL